MNGRINLILGNHDDRKLIGKLSNCFESVMSTYTLKTQTSDLVKQKVFLSHYAHRVWNCSHYGSWHLFGHSHGELDSLPWGLSMDVGVDSHNLKPISFDEVEVEMKDRIDDVGYKTHVLD